MFQIQVQNLKFLNQTAESKKWPICENIFPEKIPGRAHSFDWPLKQNTNDVNNGLLESLALFTSGLRKHSAKDTDPVDEIL